MKKCKKCKKRKSLSAYNTHSEMKDNHLNICKIYTKTRVITNRKENKLVIRETNSVVDVTKIKS